MQQTQSQPSWAYLSNEIAGPREIRYARAIVLLSAMIFIVAVSYARTPLAQFPIFIPIYVTALVICDLITAVLLFGHYRALRSRALLVLAGAYLFTATITSAYALIFPGLFAPTGLLGSGSQTSSAMYMFWHAGFPLLVLAYAMVKEEHSQILHAERLRRGKARVGILTTIAIVSLAVAAFTAFATASHGLLPVFLDVNRTTAIGKSFLVGIWFLSFVALWFLWRRTPRRVLDVWLLVVMCVWLFDIALAAVFNTGRYDLGWYVGRIYGMLAACFLLIVLLSENARHYAQMVRVSGELRSANDTLLEMSMQDGLTKLANRRSFDKYLTEQMAIAVRHKRSLALALIDVDHFKDFNDRYGHQAGDDCLKQIADALGSCSRRPADLVARYGGEEFAMLLPDTDEAGALHLAEVARRTIAELKIPHLNCSTGCHVSISGGVAVHRPSSGTTAEKLIMAADLALYEAKAAGRNQVALTDTLPI
jgi:diguanylate cyclase (GGDEF)-like protein